MTPFSLAPSAALVTGSSRGIGHAIATALQAAGAKTIFHGEDQAPPAAMPAGATYLAADLFDPATPDKLIAAAFAARPELDLLVCNAGMASDGAFLDVGLGQWERTLNLNVRAAYFVAQSFARALVARQRPGAIVFTSSTNGFQPEEGCSVYDISKGALVMMIRALAVDLAPQHIRVNGIAPGLIRTGLTSPILDALPERRRHYEKKILLGRLGTPEDCTGAVTFLLSPAAAYVTGQILVVDGGLTVGQVGKM